MPEAAERGALVLVGRCYDLGETPPYGPWAEALARASRAATALPDRRISARARRRRQPGGALRAGARTTSPPSPRASRWSSCSTTCTGPTPPASTCCASSRAASPTLPLLLLATYRADELTRRHPLYALLPAAGARGPRRAPRPAPAGRGGHRARWSRARYALPARGRGAAGGLPARRTPRATRFFLGELLRTLEDEGLLRPARRRAAGRWATWPRCGCRPLLRQVIDARLARLGEEARRLLAVAAVIGQEVPLDLWAAVGEATRTACSTRSSGRWRRALLAETPDGRGCASPTRSSARRSTRGRCRRGGGALHRRVAEALLATPAPDPDAVAYHFQRAGDPRAAEWLVRGGRAGAARLRLADRRRALRGGAGAAGGRGERRGRARLAAAAAWRSCRRYADPRAASPTWSEARAPGRGGGRPVAGRACRGSTGASAAASAGDCRRGLAEMAAALAALEALPPGSAAARPPRAIAGALLHGDGARAALVAWLALPGTTPGARATARARRPRADPPRVDAGRPALGDAHPAWHACAALGDRPRRAGRSRGAAPTYQRRRASQSCVADALVH